MDKSRRTPFGAILLPGAMPGLSMPYPEEFLGKVIQWSDSAKSGNSTLNYVFPEDPTKCFYSIPDEILATLQTYFCTIEKDVTKPSLTAADLVALRKGEFSTDDIIRLKEKGVL